MPIQQSRLFVCTLPSFCPYFPLFFPQMYFVMQCYLFLDETSKLYFHNHLPVFDSYNPVCQLTLWRPLWDRHRCPLPLTLRSLLLLRFVFVWSTCPCRYELSFMVSLCHLALWEPFWAKHRWPLSFAFVEFPTPPLCLLTDRRVPSRRKSLSLSYFWAD